jgi:hypothetical protein
MYLRRKTQVGASAVEATLLLPLALWLGLAALQLLWIFWAQQTLHNTGHYVLRSGQIGHAQESAMQNTLATGMSSVELQWYAEPLDDDHRQQRASAIRAAAKSMLHARLASQVIVHSPTDAEQARYREQRFSLPAHEWIDEIAIDHAQARTSTLTPEATQLWLAARQLDIEIWWCLPLRVPLVAPALQSWWQLVDNPAQRFCRMREPLVGYPLWPLVTRRKGPMLSGFRLD